MKNFLIIFFIINLVTWGQGDFTWVETESEQKKALISQFYHKSRKTAGANIDVKHIRFHWKVDPAIHYINGFVKYTFRSLEDLQSTTLLLDNPLVIDSIIYHGQTITYSRPNDTLVINFPTTILTGQIDSFTIVYQGAPNTSGFGSFETSTHGNNIPVMWTLSQPYGAYEWWPTKNDLKDKIDSIDVIITMPSAFVAASHGLLFKDTVVQGQRVMHWKHRYPIVSYLVAFAVSNYERQNNQVQLSQGSLPLVNYVYPEHAQDALNAIFALKLVMQFYDSLVGPYPFMQEKYGQAEFNWGGGMEHQTISFIGNMTNYELCAHELIHMWFGDAITCGSWQDIWLNEGFATYFTALNYERFFPTTYWMPWKIHAIQYITSEPYGSVYVYDTTDVYRIFDGRLSYYKGAYVLHMLRWILSDSTFFSAIRAYYASPQFKYGFVRTEDFKHFLEQHSGKNLTEFFNDWVYGEGHPIYSWELYYHNDDSTKIILHQSTSHPSVDFFEMPVPVYFFKGNQIYSIVLNHTQPHQTFYVPFPFPDSIQLDPQLWILKQLPVQGIVGTDALPEQPLFKLYPNPADKESSINIEFPYVGQISIISTDGKEVLTLWHQQKSILDPNVLKPGVYYISFKNERITAFHKLIISNTKN
ncbi:MAG: M1 family aminopeptidase [Bacteroidales bacterium]|nr:M1 family aminopeptidase [Bacteroidales bacterium]